MLPSLLLFCIFFTFLCLFSFLFPYGINTYYYFFEFILFLKISILFLIFIFFYSILFLVLFPFALVYSRIVRSGNEGDSLSFPRDRSPIGPDVTYAVDTREIQHCRSNDA